MIEFKNLRIDLGDVVIEIVSIVLAILLAFVISNWHERSTRQAALHAALVNIHDEMLLNRRLLKQEIPVHLHYQQQFQSLVESAHSEHISFDRLGATIQRASKDGFHEAALEAIAWEIAQNSTALTDMQYRQRATLTQIYDIQAITMQRQDRFASNLILPSAAANGNWFYSAVESSENLGDVVAAEAELAQGYDRELKELPSQ